MHHAFDLPLSRMLTKANPLLPLRWIDPGLNCRTSSWAKENMAGEEVMHVHKAKHIINGCQRIILVRFQKLQGDEGTG